MVAEEETLMAWFVFVALFVERIVCPRRVFWRESLIFVRSSFHHCVNSHKAGHKSLKVVAEAQKTLQLQNFHCGLRVASCVDGVLQYGMLSRLNVMTKVIYSVLEEFILLQLDYDAYISNERQGVSHKIHMCLQGFPKYHTVIRVE